MELAAAGLTAQPFRTHGRPAATVTFASFDQGLETLEETLRVAHGLTSVQGPPLSGKTTLINTFVDRLPEDYPVAIIDGAGLATTPLLETVLRQFGYVFEHTSPNELLGLLRVFVLQQAARGSAPLLIIEHSDTLMPDALRTLCDMADFSHRGACALKLVLVSERPLKPLIDREELDCLSAGIRRDFHLRPMNRWEATRFLHNKLAAAGSDAPDFIFAKPVCEALWRASGGWPGILDRVALLALAAAETLPVSPDYVKHPALPCGTWPGAADKAGTGLPTLVLSLNGEVLRSMTLDVGRLLIGRSEHNDIAIKSPYISRHHALIVRHGDATFLLDLHSANGTLVNSKPVNAQVLMHNDVISLGHYRIKFRDERARADGTAEQMAFADTSVMKSLEDMRDLLADDNTATLPVLTDRLPKSGG